MPDEMAMPLAKRTPRWQVALNWSLPLVLIAVFAWQIHKSWPAIRAHHWEVLWGWMIGALALLLLNSLLETLIWNRTLGWFTAPLAFGKAVPVYIWSSLARYIPGKIASLVARVGLAAEVDRPVIPVLASSTVELALRIASGSLLLLFALFGTGVFTPAAGQAESTTEMIDTARLAALITIPLVLICAHPKIMLPVMNWALRKIKKPEITRRLRYRDVLAVFAMIIGRWIVYGGAFVLIAAAVAPSVALPNALLLLCLAAGSWALGFILLSPGGLGIAEALQFLLLTKMGFPAPLPTVIPVAFRLGSLAAEGAWALAAIFLRKSWGHERTAPEAKQAIG